MIDSSSHRRKGLATILEVLIPWLVQVPTVPSSSSRYRIRGPYRSNMNHPAERDSLGRQKSPTILQREWLNEPETEYYIVTLEAGGLTGRTLPARAH